VAAGDDVSSISTQTKKYLFGALFMYTLKCRFVVDDMKTKKVRDEWPDLATRRRGRRVTTEEHKKYSKALDAKYGMNRPCVGRPPLGPLKARDIHLRIPPGILQRLRAKAEKLGIGYQTLIKQILSRAA
jgi:hypothetical protein